MTEDERQRRISELLSEAKTRQELISENLPDGVDPQALTWSSKTPYNAMCIREAQFCRAEEFARCALEALERGDVVVGISNTRSVFESLAAIWFLNRKLEIQLRDGLSPDIHEQLGRMLLGFKNDSAFPEAVNAVSMIDRMDETLPGIRQAYDRMSEFAHPNYSGALGVYGSRDDSAITWFKRGGEKVDMAKVQGLSALCMALTILELCYNRTAELIGPFCALFDATDSS